MESIFYMDDDPFSCMAIDVYPQIVNNPRISQEIKNAWLELCIINADVDILCCW